MNDDTLIKTTYELYGSDEHGTQYRNRFTARFAVVDGEYYFIISQMNEDGFEEAIVMNDALMEEFIYSVTEFVDTVDKELADA